MKIYEDLRGLLEKLADDKLVGRNNDMNEHELAILRRKEATNAEDSLKEKQPDDKEVMQSLVEKIPEEILRQTTF